MNCVKEHSIITKIFVATDDYNVFRDLCALYPEYDFFTMAKSTDLGYQQGKFNNSDAKTKFNRILDLFADIEVLTKADLFVGTFSSNVGQFMIIHRNGYRCHMIDYNLQTL